MTKEEIITLTDKIVSGLATDDEMIAFNQLYRSFQGNNTRWDEILLGDREQLEMQMRTTIINKINSGKSVVRMNWKRWTSIAASVLLVISLGILLLIYNNPKSNESVKTSSLSNDVKAPETNRAMITLINGQRVYLDSAGNGQLATQGNVRLVKLSNGQIEYQAEKGEAAKEVQINTLYNPRGSQVINMKLADGSRVWLNAGSSVTFPVVFAGNERKVSITGEAYFEITHDAARPFWVTFSSPTAGGREGVVQVLGTHFNVNAYEDEEVVKITLLEGSVKVSVVSGQSSGLKPGQQATLAYNSQFTIHDKVDLEQVMAWKNGVFKFRDTNIEAIMRQVARWYDVEISYQGNFADLNFGGTVSRKANVSELLKRLEATEAVHFTVEGRKITVIK